MWDHRTESSAVFRCMLELVCRFQNIESATELCIARLSHVQSWRQPDMWTELCTVKVAKLNIIIDAYSKCFLSCSSIIFCLTVVCKASFLYECH